MPPTSTKKPFAQPIPDPVIEPIQPATVVIIHPGSYNLRLGRASDPYPITIPHCVARRKKVQSPRVPESWLMRPECNHPEANHLMKTGLKNAEEALLTKPNSMGGYRQTTSNKQHFAYNQSSKGERTDVICPLKWTQTDKKPACIIGEEALYVHPSDNYTLHWPMRRGRLNLHGGPCGSLTSVMADLEVIWSKALETYLSIPIKDLKHYKAIMLIPDVYIHKHVKALMNLLLDTLGFGAAFIHQESVCATYGTGVPCACVVDVGDQKTSISCVEDGISHKPTRLTMEYGGSDVTRCFRWMLRKSGVPLPEVDLSIPTDILLMQELKESFCHMDVDRSGIVNQFLQIRQPQKPIIKFNLRLADELLLSPLGMLYPDMFAVQGQQLVRVQTRFDGDPVDPHDESYLRQTQRAQRDLAKLGSKKENQESRDVTESSQLEDTQLSHSQMDDDSNDAPETLALTETKTGRRHDLEEEEEEDTEPVAQLMGVDEAILHCIEQCGSEDLKRKMYSCIVVVGGGLALFEGAQSWLQHRVWLQMPNHQRLMMENMDVLTRPKDNDPRVTCWKGAAVMACLDTTQELWIRPKEWQQYSCRLLRERAPFIW
ncbi:actin-related protein 8-like [Haliotis rubra]|uniref:actin-related protein 8-like n=1 Tax=Haliotis rubra TaxID=36100 RepID=UPI001EE619E0|nr:actin-related protein 8-like [Haliotis rubra]